ncbi:MAG: hypothetical protein ACUVX9_02195 [Anaerolineae bacterium]
MQGDAGTPQEGYLAPTDLRPESFLPYYERVFELENELEDDAFRAMQPFPAIPWSEAIIGCRIRRSGQHFWAEKLQIGLSELAGLRYEPSNPWVQKYVEFLQIFSQRFPSHPVGQSILRGPTDLLATALGDEAAVLALMDEPELSEKALWALTEVLVAFIRHQWEHTPSFAGGYVIGQYDVWAPGPVTRLQEDAISLYSPAIYRRLVLPCDQRLCELTPHNLMHLHASCSHLLPVILANERLGAVQMSKDEGGTTLEGILPSLQMIQGAGKPLVIKGRFTLDEVALMKASLEPAGLCVQPVVDSLEAAQAIMPSLMQW